ncbi:ABC transporter permease [Alteromonas sp.]|uniref:ABC transporter permease n=1 Tax=Alteromonas sp. TaxID=232 RepID=UPI000B700E9B|nr:ABC transporter permease [Alteromonas sp.]MAI39531.1 sodium ABC transporter permease [Alteromonas sp.]OUX83653.1 MAG: sodium ABC transporter permease [Alteromonas sp. TMED35]|tara:strand:+ start:14547 stop:15779 length:1233 start_codon:yes stop_codon:yes gene_type:complete
MWLIFKKEFKELLRDRKTIIFMILLPLLLFPAIFGVGIFFMSNAAEKAENEILKYAIVGEAYAPDIVESFSQASDKFEQVAIDGANTDTATATSTDKEGYATLIKNDTLDFVLVIPETFNPDILTSGQHKIELYLNDAGLNKVYGRVAEIIDVYMDEYQLSAFTQLGLNESQQEALLKPISIEKQNIADDREVWGERIGGFLPYFIFILCLQGAMAPAADLGAGEKERGTLETLLISPMDRYKLVLGKFFTVSAAGIITALITVSSMALWGIVLSQGMAIEFVVEVMSMIGIVDFVLIFLMLVPVVAVFAAILLSLSIYARSFKEAQSYMGSLIMVVIFPVLIAMMPGVELKGAWVWVPLTNVALAMKELFKGTMDYFALFGIFTSTAVIAIGLIMFCIHWFNKEKVLFR